MGLYSVSRHYDLSTWYENSGAYDLWVGTDLMLDLSRHILLSGAYVFQGVAFPKGEDVTIEPGSTFEGSLNLIPYSYVLYLTGFAANGNQFTVRIYDKGAQTDVYAKQMAWFPTVVSNMEGSANEGFTLTAANAKDRPFGPYFFRDPLIILPPGVLQIQLTNVGPVTGPGPAAQSGEFQLFFGVAIPRNSMSLQNRQVLTSTDQTGVQSMQTTQNGTTASLASTAMNFFGS
jgi:hypothetical protein